MTPRIFDLDRFTDLPMWAQVYIASRFVRRAAMAMLPEGSTPLAAILAACDAMDSCATTGKRARAVRNPTAPSLPPSLAQSLRCAQDAMEAALAPNSSERSAEASSAARNAINAISADPRVGNLQLMILLAADIDQLRFACAEAGVRTHDALTDAVMQRMPPVHAITLHEPKRSPEDDAR